MNTMSGQAVLDHVANATALLILARGTTIQTEFTELRACEFPIWTSRPVSVEIPPNGTKSYIVAPAGCIIGKSSDGDFPAIVKFPIYTQQQIVGTGAFAAPAAAPISHPIAKIPLVAVGTAASAVVDDKLVQRYHVLPFWNDGSTVLVRLDWFEGEPAEGTPNPEWHMSATSGMPAALGLKQLDEAAHLPPGATRCRYRIHVTPWLLGAALLEDEGLESTHPVWQREWPFDGPRGFATALKRLTRGLREVTVDHQRDAAESLVETRS